MTWSLIIAILIVAAVIYFYLRSRRQDAHHLDDIHITENSHDKETMQ